MTDRKIISRRKLHGLKTDAPYFAQIEQWPALSVLLGAIANDGGRKIFLAGTLEEMTREYLGEPLTQEWAFSRSYIHKHRSPTYQRYSDGAEVAVKLIGHRESWFPGCADQVVGCEAWKVLESEWKSSTGLPLLSSPAATGKALLWETLPKGQQFPALPDDVARLIRSNSPQHRLEKFNNVGHLAWFNAGADESLLHQYDGRLMYAAMCGRDRFPVGEPREVSEFKPYQPGWYQVSIEIPKDWNHIGLIPVKDADGGWMYPARPGETFGAWVSEPELTLALANGWKIAQFWEGYAFDKGRPLENWSKKLIDMRAEFQDRAEYLIDEGALPNPWPYRYAAAAVRQILNHTIGAIHVDGYEREVFISDDNWRQWRRDNAEWFNAHDSERVDGGYIVSQVVPSESQLDIYMPHWSSTIYALSRAGVAQWALKCDPATLVKIHGDAIYMTAPAPWDGEDNGRVGQLRRKES